MLCTELQGPKSSKGTAINEDSVLAYVINHLMTDGQEDIRFARVYAFFLAGAWLLTILVAGSRQSSSPENSRCSPELGCSPSSSPAHNNLGRRKTQ
ncbi:hypothetical protein ACS0TY_016268 [Phlomoides rotata]